MKLFFIPSKKNIAQDLCKIFRLYLGRAEVKRFLNGDLYIQIGEKIKGEKCLVLGGTEDEQILETAFLSHTLKKEGAREIIAIIPYLSYGRQDRNIPGRSLGIKIVGEILKASGIKKIVVIDVHSQECKKLFPIPLISLNPYKFFAKQLRRKKWKGVCLVAPDKGAVNDTKFFKKALKKKIFMPIFYIQKRRMGKKVKIMGTHGTVLKEAILVDDMLDSGRTMIEAVKEIKKRGAKNMTIIVSHAPFTGEKWKELWKIGVEKIYCTDSVNKKIKDKRIVYLKSAEVLAEYFK